MAVRDVKPTRSELIELKKKINLSVKGHKLLKMKRDGLIMEFFKLLDEAKALRSRMAGNDRIAREKLAVAYAVEGSVALKSAALALVAHPEIQLARKNLMGVVVPDIKGTTVRSRADQRGYGMLGTSAHVDEAAKAYEQLVADVVKAAELETSMKRLLDEVEKTKRRVNALEFKVIPELSQARDFIRLRLEEMERENIFRLKKIKAKSEAAAA